MKLHFIAWIDQYGYIVLLVTLMLELIAFGIPTEIIMTYAGFLVFQGKLGWIPAILVAGIGSSIGITIAYFIGLKLGAPFFYKYGRKVHMGPERLDKFSEWFGKYGNKLIIAAYFIPGVRHITGYFSGITKIPFYKFAVYAYLGAFIWVSTFISLGKVLGPRWQEFHSSIKKYLVIGGILLVIVLALVYLYKRSKGRILESARVIMTKSPLRARIWIIGTAVVFVALFALMVGMIQDYLANEFTQFNAITTLIVHSIFVDNAAAWMKLFTYLSSPYILISLTILRLLWIVVRGRERILETIFFVVVVVGGEVLEELLQYVFGRLAPGKVTTYATLPASFPSEQSLMALTIWGFFAYLVVRHTKRIFISSLATIFVLLISILLGISHVYFGFQSPSDIVAGYVFAGVWVSLNVMLLDILSELRRSQFRKAKV